VTDPSGDVRTNPELRDRLEAAIAKRHLEGFAIAHYWFNRTPSLIELYRGEVAEGLHDCDPELVPLREQARDTLARLSAEPQEVR